MTRFRVASPFDGKNFVYRTSELGFKDDFYNRFLAAPGELVARETSRWLSASSLFPVIYGSAAPMEPELLLEGEVGALYGDLREGMGKAVLEMTITLTRGGGTPELLLHRSYREAVPLRQENPAALALGWSEALGEILAALEHDLRQVARSR